MKINNQISLAKFLKMYYNISGGKTKYLRHKNLKYFFPELKCIHETDKEIINKNISLGIWLKISDCEGEIMYCQNPFYNQSIDLDTTVFEKSDEFKNALLYHRFRDYEEVSDSDEYLNPLDIPNIPLSELCDMKKWELLELKRKLEVCNKITMGAYYILIAKVKKELGLRRKEEIGERRSYTRKKENRRND